MSNEHENYSVNSLSTLGSLPPEVLNYDSVQFERLASGYLLGEFKNYRLLECLGEGGMGQTWLAEELSGGEVVRNIVVKILSKELCGHEEALAEVRRVFDLTSKLFHSNICATLGMKKDLVFGWFLVMDYAAGGTLWDWFKSQPNHENGLPLEKILPILRPIAEALDFAHRKGILHRDVKPQNIMFAEKTPLLIDFGIAARIHPENVTHSTQTLGRSATRHAFSTSGTPVYMAPEQMMGKPQTGRTDQYALGMVLYELLTGKIPFSGENFAEIAFQKAAFNPENPNLSASVNSALRKALSMLPDQRFTTCSEFILALENPSSSPIVQKAVPKSAPEPVEEPQAMWVLEYFRAEIREAISRRKVLLKNYLPESARVAEQNSVIVSKCVGYLREIERQTADLPNEIARMRAEGMREDGPQFRSIMLKLKELPRMMLEFSSENPPQTPEECEILLNWKEELERREAQRRAKEERLRRKVEEKRRREEAGKKAKEERLWRKRFLVLMPKNPSAGTRWTVKLNGIEYAFRWCPPGRFAMGSPENIFLFGGEWGRCANEVRHEVTLTQGFWMLETQVTQAMWKSVMGKNPSEFPGDLNPVEQVSWTECRDFCGKLSLKLGVSLSLPTEAQWEYACRAGTIGPYAGNLNAMGWFWENSGKRTHPVGLKKPNAWGLYDMHGNVWEWCLDWYGPYAVLPTSDPKGPHRGSDRVFRGGGWNRDASRCRSASRHGLTPDSRSCNLGFRMVLANPEK